MDKGKILAILDKNIDQQGLAKDLAGELIKPEIAAFKAKIESGEIDPIPGTKIENLLIGQVLGAFQAYLDSKVG